MRTLWYHLGETRVATKRRDRSMFILTFADRLLLLGNLEIFSLHNENKAEMFYCIIAFIVSHYKSSISSDLINTSFILEYMKHSPPIFKTLLICMIYYLHNNMSRHQIDWYYKALYRRKKSFIFVSLSSWTSVKCWVTVFTYAHRSVKLRELQINVLKRMLQ